MEGWFHGWHLRADHIHTLNPKPYLPAGAFSLDLDALCQHSSDSWSPGQPCVRVAAYLVGSDGRWACPAPDQGLRGVACTCEAPPWRTHAGAHERNR